MGITRNGRKVIGALFTNSSGRSNQTMIGDLKLTNQKGEMCSGVLNRTGYTYACISYLVGYYSTSCCDINKVLEEYSTSTSSFIYRLGICLGTNDTKETVDDYTMQSTGLKGKTSNIVRGGNGGILQITTSAYNNTNESITVKEIGIGLWGVASASNYSDGENCLLFRKILDSPVTIKPDETYSFSIILK